MSKLFLAIGELVKAPKQHHTDDTPELVRKLIPVNARYSVRLDYGDLFKSKSP